MKSTKLTQNQRIIVAVIYFLLLLLTYKIIHGSFKELLVGTADDTHIWFFSGAFLIILGKYIAEPFFSKPTDAIANSAAIIITLLSLNNKDELIQYKLILFIAILVLVLSITTIFLKNVKNEKLSGLNNFSYAFATKIGNSKVLFSMIYISAVLSYFAYSDNPNNTHLIVLFAFWMSIVLFDLVGMFVGFICKLLRSGDESEEEIGEAIGCENPFLYQVEIDYLKHKKIKLEIGDLVTVENEKLYKSVGMVINSKQLLNKKWLEIYLLTEDDNSTIKISQNHRLKYLNENSILKSINSVYKLKSIESLPENIREKVNSSKLYKKRENFVGYVEKGSNIHQIAFQQIGKKEIKEGGIVLTAIYGKDTLYQLIDGQTREEPLEYKDGYGYEVAFARKLRPLQ